VCCMSVFVTKAGTVEEVQRCKEKKKDSLSLRQALVLVHR